MKKRLMNSIVWVRKFWNATAKIRTVIKILTTTIMWVMRILKYLPIVITTLAQFFTNQQNCSKNARSKRLERVFYFKWTPSRRWSLMVKFFCSPDRWLRRGILIFPSQRGFTSPTYSNMNFRALINCFWLPSCWLRGRSPIRLGQHGSVSFRRNYSPMEGQSSTRHFLFLLFFLLCEIAAVGGSNFVFFKYRV